MESARFSIILVIGERERVSFDNDEFVIVAEKPFSLKEPSSGQSELFILYCLILVNNTFQCPLCYYFLMCLLDCLLVPNNTK